MSAGRAAARTVAEPAGRAAVCIADQSAACTVAESVDQPVVRSEHARDENGDAPLPCLKTN